MIGRHHAILEKAVSLGLSSRHFLAFKFVNLATGTAFDVGAAHKYNLYLSPPEKLGHVCGSANSCARVGSRWA